MKLKTAKLQLYLLPFGEPNENIHKQGLTSLDHVSVYVRVHSHSGKFGVDVSARCICSVTGEGLWRWHLVPPTELQRTAAVQLFDLWQVRLSCYHHTRNLAVHEVLLRGERNG